MMQETEEAVKAHTKMMETGLAQCHQKACARCGQSPGSFQLHERRRRQFLLVVSMFVKILWTWLARWKCPLCGKTFTEYPSFAVPHKRYVREEVFERSERYVEEEEMTYRRVVREKGMPIGYEGNGESRIDERQLSPSTVWRWVGFLGGLREQVRRGLRLIRETGAREAGAKSDLARRIWSVSSRKYQSDERRKVLEWAKKVFGTAEAFFGLFGRSLFPDFATGLAFG